MRVTPSVLASGVEDLKRRAVTGGGFAAVPGAEAPRPDATAWAVLLLSQLSIDDDGLGEHRNWLQSLQLDDGRVVIDAQHRAAYWPTPVVSLAWLGSPEHRAPLEAAVSFLLGIGGLPTPRHPALGHDSTLIGWSWIERTHSWVEPTGMAIMVLRLTGHQEHPRVEEATRLLLDRQLRSGGWNYGNTTAFGQELRPAIDSTGVALCALTGLGPAIVEALCPSQPQLLGLLVFGRLVFGHRGYPIRREE